MDDAFFLTEVKLTYKTDTINVYGLNMKQQMRLNELMLGASLFYFYI